MEIREDNHEEEVNYEELSVKEFLDEILHDGLEMGAPNIGGSDSYAISISMQPAQMYYENDYDDEKDGIIGLKCGTAEVEISVNIIYYIWKYNDGSYQIGFTIPMPDMTLMYI